MEKVAAGIYDVGVCAGNITTARSLLSQEIGKEEMVLVSNKLKATKSLILKDKPLLIIENKSATWKSIKNVVTGLQAPSTIQLESFFSIAQLSKYGFGVGVVPICVAQIIFNNKKLIQSFKPKLYRPIQVVFKKSSLQKNYFNDFINRLSKIQT